jgi:hypothetical protein
MMASHLQVRSRYPYYLPTELLALVFTFYALCFHDPCTPPVMVYVCRLWKQIAYGTPLVWARVCGCQFLGPDVVATRETGLGSRQPPLDFFFRVHDSMLLEGLDLFIRWLHKEKRKVRSIRVSIDSDSVEEHHDPSIDPMIRPMVNYFSHLLDQLMSPGRYGLVYDDLRSMRVDWKYHAPCDTPIFDLAEIAAPALETLSLRGIRLRTDLGQPRLRSLCHLAIVHHPSEAWVCTFVQLVRTFAELPALKSLLLDDSLNCTDWGPPDADPVTLSALAFLFVRDTAGRVACFLDAVHCPGLLACRLWIGVGCDDGRNDDIYHLRTAMASSTMQTVHGFTEFGACVVDLRAPSYLRVAWALREAQPLDLDFDDDRLGQVAPGANLEREYRRFYRRCTNDVTECRWGVVTIYNELQHIANAADAPYIENIADAEIAIRSFLSNPLEPRRVDHLLLRGVQRFADVYVLGIEAVDIIIDSDGSQMPNWMASVDPKGLETTRSLTLRNTRYDIDTQRALAHLAVSVTLFRDTTTGLLSASQGTVHVRSMKPL